MTTLRKCHKAEGKNSKQNIKIGDVVLIHSNAPRTSWRMAVIEDLIKGKDGCICAADIRTSSGKTNRPTAKPYPLEVLSSKNDKIVNLDDNNKSENTNNSKRPIRDSAMSAQKTFPTGLTYS